MVTTPFVTVLTAARNARRYLPETVRSIQAQTFRDWEYIIVDDASDDDTAEVVVEFARADARLRLVRRETAGGPYAAANEGLQSARGRYVARIDADDIALPDRLERQLTYLERNRDLRACAGSILKMDDTHLTEPSGRALPVLPGSLKWRFCVRGGLAHSTLCVERSALEELGCYREVATSQDYRMWCELSRRRWLGFVPDVLVHWRVHGEQLTSVKAELQMRNSLDVQRDHVNALSPEPWNEDDLMRLRWVGRRPQPLVEGLRIIARFKRLWTHDTTLDRPERREMMAFTSGLRVDHLRTALRSGVGSVPGAERLIARARLKQRSA